MLANTEKHKILSNPSRRNNSLGKLAYEFLRDRFCLSCEVLLRFIMPSEWLRVIYILDIKFCLFTTITNLRTDRNICGRPYC